MASVSIPYSFTNTYNADATQVNSNFNTLAVFLNTEAIQRDGSVAFTGIPTLPALSPSSANHAVRKAYVDSFFPVTSANITDGTIVAGDIANATITKDKFATTAGQLGGSWTTFTQATARNSDTNVSSLSINGAYLLVGKTCTFRMQAQFTTVDNVQCALGLPSVIGSTIGYVQPVNGIINVSGLNKKSVTARMDADTGVRVQFFADADGSGFAATQAVTVTLSGTFEVV